MLLIVLLTAASPVLGQGVRSDGGGVSPPKFAPAAPVLGPDIALYGVSPVNQSMGGAAVGCPIDSAGALFWNPASLSRLPCSEIAFGIQADFQSSQLAANSPSNGFFPSGASGTDSSATGVIPLPSLAFVHKDEDSPLSFGVGLFGIGGSKVNYLPDSSTSFFSSSGVGPLSASVSILQAVPAISYQLTEHLSLGAGLTLTKAELIANPQLLTPASSPFPQDQETRDFWGGGFEVGLFRTTDYGWDFGVSFKSRQWMEPIRYKSVNGQGQPVDTLFQLDYPTILSIGTSYRGFSKWILAADVRYFDYAGTPGFGSGGFSSNGSLAGLNWRNVLSVGLGVQREVTDKFFVRLGYNYNDNPIDSGPAVLLNVAQPLITQHSIHMGASYVFADNWSLAMAYAHGFENSVSGPIVDQSLNPLPNTQVATRVSVDALSVGVSKRF